MTARLLICLGLCLVALAAQAASETTPTAVQAALERNDRIRTIWVVYSQVALSGTDKGSSFEFIGKADKASSSGWTLSIERDKQGRPSSAILTEYASGTAFPHVLGASSGAWRVVPSQMQRIPEQDPVEQCVSFYARPHLPGTPLEEQHRQILLVDGRPEQLPVAAVQDANSSATLTTREPGIVSIEGRSEWPKLHEKESVEEFTRTADVGLVPKRKITLSRLGDAPARLMSFELKELRINDPRMRLGSDEDSSQSVLQRYHP